MCIRDSINSCHINTAFFVSIIVFFHEKFYLMSKYLIARTGKYIFIILTATIFSLITFSKSFSEENVFIINNVKVEGSININFSRDKYINKAFLNSFKILMSKILLSRDLNKISNIKLNKIKNLINSFQILEESYRNDEYKATFKIFYNDIKVIELLKQKNISFSQPKNISAIFFPVLFVNEEIQDFYENFFYKQWTTVEINNELINFILPLEDLDDISKIKEMKNRIEELNIDDFVNKYNIKNYVFTLMHHQNDQLNIYVKTNFNDNRMSKNITYELNDIKNELKLNYILKDLKMQITDIWKKENVIDLSIPLLIRIKFQHTNLRDLDNLKNTFYKINIIDNYSLEEFNINYAFFKIYYYGNPKRLRTELLKFGYQLNNDQGHWGLYIND